MIREKIATWIGKSLRALGINTPGLMDYFLFGGGQATASGVRITETNALTISTVHQCVRVIADTVASLPCFVYRRLPGNGGKERAVDHPLYTVLHEEPNPYMTPFEFKQTLTGHLLLWGNAYAEIQRDGGGKVEALWPLRPDQMRVQLYHGKIFYYYTTQNGAERQITDIFHLRGLSSDGLMGLSPIALARETLGLAKASEEYRSRFFANDARPGGILLNPGELGDLAYARLKKAWDESHAGLNNRNRIAILEKGTTWQDVGIPPDDAQFVQGEEFQKSDIAAIFRVPSYKIGLLKPGTVSYASVEQQAIDFVVDCIRPWLVCWEERVTLALLTPRERNRYFAEFLVDALLRGDSAQRASFYTAMFNIGALTQNEIRSKESLNGFGSEGDRHYISANMIPVDAVDDLIKAKTEPLDITPPLKPAQLNGSAH